MARRHKEKTQADYARSVVTALITLVILGGLIGAAFFLDSQIDLRKELQIPRYVKISKTTVQIPDVAIPISLGCGAFILLMGVATIGFAPFFRGEEDELDEYGMYKRDYPID